MVPPDGGFAWFIVVAVFFSNFLLDGIMYTFGAVMPAMTESLHSSSTAASFIGSLQVGTCFMSGPVVCALVNKYGFRILALCGVLIVTTGITFRFYKI